MKMKLFAIKDIQPNPFRHIDRYPIKSEKVTTLRESLRVTGFWGNMVARLNNGNPQIAYGHHRLVALKEEFGPNQKVALIISDLSDEQMLQIMARENMEEWGSSASIEHETVRAVIQAHQEGKISFRQVGKLTAQTVADFVGWLKPNGKAQDKVHSALAALQFIEEGLLNKSDFEGLTTMQAQAVVEQTRKAQKRREETARFHRKQAEQAERQAKEAKTKESRDLALKRQKREEQKERESQKEAPRQASRVGKAVSESLKAGKIGYKGARDIAAEIESKTEKVPPDIELFAQKLATNLNKILRPEGDETRVKKLQALIKFKKYLEDSTRVDLAKTLKSVSDRSLKFANQLSKKSNTKSIRKQTRRLIP